MAARALTAAVAGRRVAGPPLLASWRSGEAYRNHFSASAQAQREEDHKDAHGAATTREQVEAALNRKNVEVLQGEEHVATVLPDEAIDICAAGAGEDASWVPDQETGVFGPADPDIAATNGPSASAGTMPTEGGSVLDQPLFLREEEMQDVERPAMANANGSNKNSY
uniref:Uncharacterized protein n=1 Tax=Avena sativa TaxID=4498 RepID=A0ACD5XWK7_AVESA